MKNIGLVFASIILLCLITTESYATSYYVGDDCIFFSVKRLRSLNKNNDIAISSYIKKVKYNKSCTVNQYYQLSAKKGYYLLFFWKNIDSREWGFVIAEPLNRNNWRVRLNGMKEWSVIKIGQQEMFKWFTSGRSVGVSLANNRNFSLKYLFSGNIDLKD